MFVRTQSQREEKPMKQLGRASVDIAKNVFHVHGMDSHEQVQWQSKLSRSDWINKLCKRLLPDAEIGMEACASAHYWARQLRREAAVKR